MNKILCADFETTVYEGQEDTEVWAVALAELGCTTPNEVLLFNSIDSFMTSFKKLGLLSYSKVSIFFHNLKFDGSFILNWLLSNKKHAVFEDIDEDGHTNYSFKQTRNLLSGEFKYLVSSRGQFYSITYKLGKTLIIFMDSVKLLPLSVREIGEEFNTRFKKSTMEYKGFRWAGWHIKPSEESYIKKDVLVMTEALDVFISEGHEKSTIGSNCLAELFKIMGGKKAFYELFPKLEEIDLPNGMSADEYCRLSYKGAFCICFREGIHKKGITVDVNSEYPFVMKEFKLPFGSPKYHTGTDAIEIKDNRYVFVRVRCNFRLKKNKLPTIQIKNNMLYQPNEWLKTSYVFGDEGIPHSYGYIDGEKVETRQELILCETDYILLHEHYNLFDYEVVDWLEFQATKGLFNEYIDKYFNLKAVSEGGKRLIYKLFLNNLYGKLGTSPDSSFKVARLEDGVLKWHIQHANEKETYHVASASAIIGGGRYWCITHAQANYEHFCYADTDSLHLSCSKEDAKMIEFDKTALGKWDLEMEWDIAKFVRQKTYVEINKDKVNLAACGMGKYSQKNVMYALRNKGVEDDIDFNQLDLDFIKRGMSIEEFDRGLIVPSNLKSKQIKGGCLLSEDVFEIR